jgi:DNA-binding transcriptional MerR regulator
MKIRDKLNTVEIKAPTQPKLPKPSFFETRKPEFKPKVLFHFADNNAMKKVKMSKRIFLIREASEITGVPAHTIRFWEKDFSTYLKPYRTDGGQRRYSLEDIEIIKKIRHFRYKEKYTIAGTINELQNNRRAIKNKDMEKMVDEIAEMIKKRGF